jgi:(1->4)-alpha-D-glucan 1-alpha-D-glucosylmutase
VPVPITATYRLQLHPQFGFAAAAGVLPYLRRLGISHLYLSPFLQAMPGSRHGYDVVDPTRVNTELGGHDGYEIFRQEALAHGLGIVIDVVPNHLAIGTPGNRWWWDVLENGPASVYASYFDVDWNPPESKLRDLVLVPILSDHYGRELERGAIGLRSSPDGGGVEIHYGAHVLPVAPRTMDTLLQVAAARCGSADLAALADAYAALPFSTATDRDSVLRRHRGKEWLRAQLRRLRDESPTVARAIDQVVAEADRDLETLHALLERQNYRLAFWRTAERELGYRRFFDINTLAGLRVEDDVVFADSHALILDWLAQGHVDGLRIDHVDGLRDPVAYLTRIRQSAPDAWLIVEKILTRDEDLRPDWPVDGTTGYDFLNQVGGLFIDPSAEDAFSSLYRELTGRDAGWKATMHDAKRLVLQQALASDVNRLTALLVDICERHRRHRDYTRHELHEALRAILVSFPTYRTYLRGQVGDAAIDADTAIVADSIAQAKRQRTDLDPALFDFLHELLANRIDGRLEGELAARFQQLTGPVMAKGVEDTALYRFNRFVGLNEVGGDPQQFGTGVDEFHDFCRQAQRLYPRRMVSTSTHDTKRSEDVRARLAVLTEIPERWAAAVRGWSEANDRHRRNGMPDANIEYLMYQTLVGAWPLEPERAQHFLLKAAREAKEHTAWNRPDDTYETALRDFIAAVLDDPIFTAELNAFVRPLLDPGRVNALAQTLIKLTAPGIPDLYQGTELWDLSLVDPDNRRPVDFSRREALLAQLDRLRPEEIWDRRNEGLPKLWLIRQTLTFRREHSECFAADAPYDSLPVRGRYCKNLVAFQRGRRVLTVVPRLTWALHGRWEDTAIELGDRSQVWRNLLTGEQVQGESIAAAALFRRFPVALLAA